MANLLNKFNDKIKAKASNSKGDVNFKVGDTVSVAYKIIEGENSRIQNFDGVVIAKSKNLLARTSNFIVRKISGGIGVERKFLFHSPFIENVKLVKSGDVKRSKLYYLRGLAGKSARIKEKLILVSSAGGKKDEE